MAHLIYYQTEREIFKDAFSRKLGTDEVKILVKKLARHYKLGEIYLSWTSGRNHSCASGWNVTINMDYGKDFGTICHELSHVMQFKKHRMGKEIGNWHSKMHRNIMKRMIAYCEKKNWFAEEFARRNTPKPEKVINPIEEKQKELIKAQEKIIKYEKKILFYQRKLAKAKKSYNMRKKHLETKILSHNSVIVKENEQNNTLTRGENGINKE